MKLVYLLLCITLSFSLDMQSDNKKATLLELFTSEGCSSCPPADDWVNTFKKDGMLFKRLIPVVFHVDYWDRLGWIDKFAKNKYTQRQYSYSRSWGTSSVYTPGFVFNGQEFKNWRSYKSKLKFSNEKVGILKASIDNNNKIHISFNGTNKINQSVIIEVSIMAMNLISKVKAGENEGETFNHNFVSIALETHHSKLKNGQIKQSISFPYFEKDNNKKYAIAVWISDKKTKKVIQAVGSYLK